MMIGAHQAKPHANMSDPHKSRYYPGDFCNCARSYVKSGQVAGPLPTAFYVGAQ